MQKGYEQLDIDNEFKNLIRPLQREEYAQLEANLVVDGCREPIITWLKTIIDGHNRYEICTRLHIPYSVQEMFFKTRDEVIIWICTNQLGRRNITDETRKYLIGRQYETEKILGFCRNNSGNNQYSQYSYLNKSDEEITDKKRRENSRRTATKLGNQYNMSSGAIQKYGKYCQALDVLSVKMPELPPKILSGNYKISFDNIVALSEMDSIDIQKISAKMGLGTTSFVRYSESRKDFSNEPAKNVVQNSEVANIPAIKIMPEYDPDSLVKGLALTIPSWVGSLDRTRINGNIQVVSTAAKNQLKDALELLLDKIQEFLIEIEGGVE